MRTSARSSLHLHIPSPLQAWKTWTGTRCGPPTVPGVTSPSAATGSRPPPACSRPPLRRCGPGGEFAEAPQVACKHALSRCFAPRLTQPCDRLHRRHPECPSLPCSFNCTADNYDGRERSSQSPPPPLPLSVQMRSVAQLTPRPGLTCGSPVRPTSKPACSPCLLQLACAAIHHLPQGHHRHPQQRHQDAAPLHRHLPQPGVQREALRRAVWAHGQPPASWRP